MTFLARVAAVGALCLTLPASSLAGLGDCGQPVTSGAKPSATDALYVLRTAVKLVTCPLHVCDTNSSGSISAGDALLTLQFAVGTPVTLMCPDATTTTTSTSSTTTSSTSSTTLLPFSTWTEIQAVFAQSCDGSGCHSSQFPGGGLASLDDYDAGYAGLINEDATCFNTSFATRVVPGDPDASYLVEKLEAKLENRAADGCSSMPLTGDALTAEQIAGIRAWITSGAPKN
jgi:hypothetical protein